MNLGPEEIELVLQVIPKETPELKALHKRLTAGPTARDRMWQRVRELVEYAGHALESDLQVTVEHWRVRFQHPAQPKVGDVITAWTWTTSRLVGTPMEDLRAEVGGFLDKAVRR